VSKDPQELQFIAGFYPAYPAFILHDGRQNASDFLPIPNSRIGVA